MKKSSLPVGCSLLLVVWLAAISLPALLWPVGSLLGMGTWHKMPDRGKSKGGWQFEFSAVYGSPELVYLLAAVGLGLVTLWWLSRPGRQAPSRFGHVAQPPSTPAGLEEALASRPERLLVEVASERESQLASKSRGVFWGLLLMVVLAWLVDWKLARSYWLGAPLSPTRWACVVLALAPGVVRCYRGLVAWKQRSAMDERLLINFSERSLGWVDLGDDRARFAESLARFDEVRVVLCEVKAAGSLPRRTLLRLWAGRPLVLLTSACPEEQQQIEAVAEELAEQMGLNLERVEEERPPNLQIG